jgi:hypothetical protein
MTAAERNDDATGGEPEPAVDGEAIELTDAVVPVVPPAPPVPPPAPPAPVLSPPPPPPPPPAPHVKPLPPIGDATSIPGAFDGHAPEPSVHPIGELAGERPELIVGAAFAGGILAAMILRRLGS